MIVALLIFNFFGTLSQDITLITHSGSSCSISFDTNYICFNEYCAASRNDTNDGSENYYICMFKCYSEPMNFPLSVSPSKEMGDRTRRREKSLRPGWKSHLNKLNRVNSLILRLYICFTLLRLLLQFHSTLIPGSRNRYNPHPPPPPSNLP